VIPGSAQLDLCLAALRFHPTYSGPALRFERYAPGFRERGVRMRVFSAAWDEVAPSHWGSAPRALREPVDDTVAGIPVRRHPLRTDVTKTRMYWEFERELFRYCQSGSVPDVIQLLDVSLSSSYWIRRHRSLGVPVVYTQTMVRDPGVGWLKNFVWRQSFGPVDCTVVSTEAMRASLRAVGFRGAVRVIPNGVDTVRFSPVSAQHRRDLRRRIQVAAEAELVVFVGGFLSYRKGVDILAEAWSSIAAARPRAVLLLVGPTLDSLRPQDEQTAFLRNVQDSLEASRAMDRVVFAGPVNDVETYLQAADVFVFPSRREGMPNVVLEAYACGVASVLCPFVGMSREFGNPGREFVESRHDAADLADRTISLLENDTLRGSLGNKARSWVADGFGVERSLDAYSSLYRDLAGETGNK
jgi:glycosyltransferase involved in cell wall biosynthesis